MWVADISDTRGMDLTQEVELVLVEEAAAAVEVAEQSPAARNSSLFSITQEYY